MSPAASPTPTALAPPPATRRSQARLRSRFMRLLAVAVAVPSVLVATLLLADVYGTQRAAIESELRADTRLAAMAVDQFVASHVAGVALMADTLPEGGVADLGALRARYPAFITALATDRDGITTAAHPISRGFGPGAQRCRP